MDCRFCTHFNQGGSEFCMARKERENYWFTLTNLRPNGKPIKSEVTTIPFSSHEPTIPSREKRLLTFFQFHCLQVPTSPLTKPPHQLSLFSPSWRLGWDPHISDEDRLHVSYSITCHHLSSHHSGCHAISFLSLHFPLVLFLHISLPNWLSWSSTVI